MQRFFGKKKPVKKGPTLDEASTRIDGRLSGLEGKIKKLEGEMRPLQQRRLKLRKGCAERKRIEKRLIMMQKKRKMYEKQRGTMESQQFNIDQTKFATDNVKDAVELASAFKEASVALKSQIQEVDLDEIEDLHDDMDDALLDVNEINDIMGRSFDVNEDMDEDELLAELDELEDDIAMDDMQDEVPDYMVSAASNTSKTQEKVADVSVDEFGLPVVPSSQLAWFNLELGVTGFYEYVMIIFSGPQRVTGVTGVQE